MWKLTQRIQSEGTIFAYFCMLDCIMVVYAAGVYDVGSTSCSRSPGSVIWFHSFKSLYYLSILDNQQFMATLICCHNMCNLNGNAV